MNWLDCWLTRLDSILWIKMNPEDVALVRRHRNHHYYRHSQLGRGVLWLIARMATRTEPWYRLRHSPEGTSTDDTLDECKPPIPEIRYFKLNSSLTLIIRILHPPNSLRSLIETLIWRHSSDINTFPVRHTSWTSSLLFPDLIDDASFQLESRTPSSSASTWAIQICCFKFERDIKYCAWSIGLLRIFTRKQ